MGLLTDALDAAVSRQHVSSPHVKAMLANGLDELRQVFHPSVQQIQPGQAPGLYGMPTTGEATAERLEEKQQEAHTETYDVPQRSRGR